MNAALAILISYLIGSLSGSLIIGKLRGVDIRLVGSGNAGATNALRTQGKLFALGTVLIDVLKGVIACLLVSKLWLDPLSPYTCTLAVVIGHCFPIFFGFKGGKGAGSGLGAIACLQPAAALIAFFIWLVCLSISGYVGPSTVIASVVAGIWVVLFGAVSVSAKICTVAMLSLVVFQHRSNLSRLLRGEELRFESARIWQRWLQKPKDRT
jgi:acyl phosphate:glycerol-3-phosphate acyltransferase